MAMISFGVLAATVFRDVKISQTTGCPLGNKTPPAHTIILVDETDKLSARELKYLGSLIRTEYLWLPDGGRLTVRNITGDADATEEILICRINDGSNVLGIARNKRKVEKDFQRIAGARLTALLEGLAAARPQPASPIAEFISQTMERPDFGANVPRRRLVVYSDFVQHSSLFSQYHVRHHQYRIGEQTESEIHHDMTGVTVRLQYVPRRSLSGIQGAGHKEFWESLLKNMGANDIAIGHDLLIGENQKREIWIDDAS